MIEFAMCCGALDVCLNSSSSRIRKILDQLTYNFGRTSSFGRNVPSFKSGQSIICKFVSHGRTANFPISIDSFAYYFIETKLLHCLYFEVDIEDAIFVASDLEPSSKTLVGHAWSCHSIS